MCFLFCSSWLWFAIIFLCRYYVTLAINPRWFTLCLEELHQIGYVCGIPSYLWTALRFVLISAIVSHVA